MLQSLHIRNLALLEEVALEFDAGFTAVTGETGAGKSILLGALSLLAGERADKSIIRQGETACEVEASLFFADSSRLDAALLALDLPICDDGVLILKRSLPRDKAPRISVNGSLATLAALQNLGEYWIDFHGPGEPRRLLKTGCQCELLDLYAKNEIERARYQGHYQHWRQLEQEHAALLESEKLSPDQIDFLRGQCARMDALDLTEEGIAALERDFQRQARAQELIQLAAGLSNGISGDDGVLGRLAALLRDGRPLESLDPASQPLVTRLQSVAVEMGDLDAEFSRLGESLQFDAADIAQLQEKMNHWLDLKRRHGGTLAAVLAARDEMSRQLELQGDIAGALARLEKEIATARKSAQTAVLALRETREKAARAFSKSAGKVIATLGFKKADFQVALVALPEMGPAGDCGVEFRFSPNVGEAPLPLARIASSGELARVMLALKSVLAEIDEVPLLVFDEVDANVGGEIGQIVGDRMVEIAERHQVLCVTHLPQVAAQAVNHLVVSKDQSGNRATVGIEPIHNSRESRVAELARMLGDRNAKSARSHAETLLGKR